MAWALSFSQDDSGKIMTDLMLTFCQIRIFISQIIICIAHDAFGVAIDQLSAELAGGPHPQRARLDYGLLWNQRSCSDN